MSDNITPEQLRSYRSLNEYGETVRHEICDKAADTIERLTKERDEARGKALEEAASVRGWWLGVDGHGEPDGTYCSVKPSDDPNAQLYVSADAIIALIDKPDPANG